MGGPHTLSPAAPSRGAQGTQSAHSSRLVRVLLALSILIYLFVVLKNAWIGDDAYITFRVVDNFVHGLGLTWNPTERVQVFTHPLWMFLISGLYAVTGDVFYTTIFLSVALSLAVILLLDFCIAKSAGMALAVNMCLTASMAFTDFSTSGLENPLTHLLLVLFLIVYSKPESRSSRGLFLLALLAGLATLNRMDTILLFFPPLAYLWLTRPRIKSLFLYLAGFLPFLAWELFSLFYFGFAFPNTAYAKLNAGIPMAEKISRGLGYYVVSFQMDPMTLTFIAAALLVALLKRRSLLIPIAMGMILYMLYIMEIGGDFMNGRFFTAPLCGAAVIFLLSGLSLKPLAGAAAYLALPALALLVPHSHLISGKDYGTPKEDFVNRYRIPVERSNYYRHASLLWALEGESMPSNPLVSSGRKVREQLDNPEEASQVSRPFRISMLGYFGFFAGPKIYIKDMFALSDLLLARIPLVPLYAWAPGHLKRNYPQGYLETLRTGKNEILDPDLSFYYDKLHLISCGRLFDLDRLRAIWEMNTGQYDSYLNSYNRPPVRIEAGEGIKPLEAGQSILPLHIPTRGLWIELDGLCRSPKIAVALSGSNRYVIVFFKEGTPIEYKIVPAGRSHGYAWVKVPDVVLKGGFDRIDVYLSSGEDACFFYGLNLRVCQRPEESPTPVRLKTSR